MVKIVTKAGLTDSFTDVPGIQVGQAEDTTVKTGVTVILPDAPIAMGVDVRGGGPGTRDTEALDPTCLIEKVHCLVLSGGSVFGLAAADGVTAELSEAGTGFAFGARAIPVVPSAILFDLANGGDKNWGVEPPYRTLGVQALKAVSPHVKHGRVGAGCGATAGNRPGGIASASLITDTGIIVSAIVAVNSFGVASPNMEHGVIDMPKIGFVGANTTIGAVATNLDLNKTACKRMAMMAQDGFARAIRPIHTPFDGDTVFAMATGEKTLEGELAPMLALVGTLAADCIVRAIEKAVAT
ncbi:MAG: P1 family peptidase [Kordiimonadaceae bacterium]|nr:P1 family peptidase [Kordiimonadaceae bacterium]